MASRQKSFFDQDHRAKAKPQWQRAREEQRRRGTELQVAQRQYILKPPIPASSASRRILKTFELDSETLSFRGSMSNNENMAVPALGTKATSVSKTPGRGQTDQSDGLQPSQNTAMAAPSTPAMRLPLAELIGNIDDMRQQQQTKELSPEDQLGWIPRSSNSALTPGQRRKRTRSSSPVSSSQHHGLAENPHHRDEPDFPLIQGNLAPPQLDPVADAWNKYAMGLEHEKLPDFIRLMNNSSPRPMPRTPDNCNVGGLRRWVSCVAELQPSGIKRRRGQGVFRDQHRITQARDSGESDAQAGLNQGSDGPSRVSILVNQIQATLAQPEILQGPTGPSSSSPLPRPVLRPHEQFRSDALQPTKLSSPPRRSRQSQTPRPDTKSASQSSPGKANDVSDYGDDVVDAAMLDEFDLGDSAFEQELLNVDIADLASRSQPIHPAESTSQSQAIPIVAIQSLPTIDEEFDEFGGDDFPTADDIEKAVPAMTMTQLAPPKVQQLPETTATSVQVEVDDDDDFGGSDIDDETLAAAELSATQAFNSVSTSAGRTRSRAIQRYLVKDVVLRKYVDKRQYERDEKVLHIEQESNKQGRRVLLRDAWLATHITPGAFIHLVGTFPLSGQMIVDDHQNMIIVHPDHLVSATAVANTIDCLRKAVLESRVKATSAVKPPLVYGNILHEVFQTAMHHNKWDLTYLHALVLTVVTRHVEQLYEAGAQDMNTALEEINSRMPELSEWASVFVGKEPKPQASIDAQGEIVNMSITKLLDVEEHVWSPMYGLKGNIDATLEVVMDDDQGRRALTVPFEIKTGKAKRTEYIGQTALYTLLLSDRYDIDIRYGLLYYMESSALSRIPAVRKDLMHLVIRRNELASYVRERLELPPMLKNEFKCGHCFAKRQCFLYHKLSEDGTTETAGVGKKFHEMVANLKPVHQTFFKHWDDLLTKEESESFKVKRELWTMLSHERAMVNRAFSQVIIEPGTQVEEHDGAKMSRFGYTLVQKEAKPDFSFLDSSITVGDAIVISSEEGHFALANGFVTKVKRRRIHVAVDRRLHNSRIRQPGFDQDTNQSFCGIMEVGREGQSTTPTTGRDSEPVAYRLDKDEFSNGLAKVRNNLLAIMDDDTPRAFEMRQLIVENVPPSFHENNRASYRLSQENKMNSDQKAAIKKVMSAKDYALVLGMPGTGKTTTIAFIIRALVEKGKSVLLTSYTHTAVDNILLKLRGDNISVLRLGNLNKIHPEVQQFAKLAAQPRSTIEELEDMYMSPQVVATTCLGIEHQIFQKRFFDYCIVDEASQITLPVCLGPIRMARTFVLVGDHHQLPPLVANKEAQKGGLDKSLFKLLSDQQPGSVATLKMQYRMCEDIMHLSNTLIYAGQLQCGDAAVASRELVLPTPMGLDTLHQGPVTGKSITSTQHRCTAANSSCWLAETIRPERRVVFANCDTIGVEKPHERCAGSRISNAVELQLVVQTVLSFLALGVPASEIGVITFYRSQLRMLQQELKGTEGEAVEMHTADKFQGRDKEVIILSCVRSNPAQNVGELLRDRRRINVALTRSRSKLIVYGSRSTLSGDELLKQFLGLVDDKKWSCDLPADALDQHDFTGFLRTGFGSAATTQRPSTVRKSRPGRTLHENRSNQTSPTGMRKAARSATVTREALLRSKPVLRDIVNDVLGEMAE